MASSTKEIATKAKGASLHIGLNFVDPTHYEGWDGALNACEFDAADMRRIAEDDQGMKAVSFIREQATRKAVLGALADAASTLSKGDLFLVTYSGHGGRLPDYSGDEEDGIDETWCLFDGELIDDELYECWSKFAAGVRILVFSDSCHSGSVYRAGVSGLVRVDAGSLLEAGVKVRAMPPGVADNAYRKHRDFYVGLQKNQLKRGWKGAIREGTVQLKCRLRLISGCTDSQFSYDGVGNGQFTSQLLKVWDNGRFRGNYDLFHRTIRKGMPDNQTPVHTVAGAADAAYDAQTPFTV